MSEEGIPVRKRDENLDDKISSAEKKISELRNEIKEARHKKSLEKNSSKESKPLIKGEKLNHFLIIIGIVNILLLFLFAINLINPNISIAKISFTGSTVEEAPNETAVVENETITTENNETDNETEPEEVLGLDMDLLETNNKLEPNRAYVYAEVLSMNSEGYVNLSIKFNDNVPEFPNFLGNNETIIAHPPSGEPLRQGQNIFCKMKLLSDGTDSMWMILDIEG